MGDLEDSKVEPEDQHIELTAPNVEEAIKLVLDHWGKIFNAFKPGDAFSMVDDPMIDFGSELEENMTIQIFAHEYSDADGGFFDIIPGGTFWEEIDEKIFIEKGLWTDETDMPRSFMDKILNRPTRKHSMGVGSHTNGCQFGQFNIEEIAEEVIKVAKVMQELYPKYFGDDHIKTVSVDGHIGTYPDRLLPLLKNIKVTIVKS